MTKVKLLLGDCLERMQDIPDGSVDMILADPPYGTTKCKWDAIIPLDPMWDQLKRIIKPNGAIALFGSEPFSSALRMSNIKNYKYDWIWEKDKATNHLNAKKMPMRITEDIMIFCLGSTTYNPQLSDKPKENIRKQNPKRKQTDIYGSMTKEAKRTIPDDKSYPIEILRFRSCTGDKGKSFHPTQKPVDLLEYLIHTYTNEDELVLDFTMGSGSTGEACINTNRNFIGIELDQEYFEIAKNRIKETL